MAYNHSKLLNVTFAGMLSEKWAKKGIAVFSVHPGNLVYTSLSRNWWLIRILFALVRPFTKSLVSFYLFLQFLTYFVRILKLIEFIC